MTQMRRVRNVFASKNEQGSKLGKLGKMVVRAGSTRQGAKMRKTDKSCTDSSSRLQASATNSRGINGFRAESLLAQQKTEPVFAGSAGCF
jgi:hypothetical protein